MQIHTPEQIDEYTMFLGRKIQHLKNVNLHKLKKKNSRDNQNQKLVLSLSK